MAASDVTYEDESYFQRLLAKEVKTILDNNDWSSQKVDKPTFWPTKTWLQEEGYSSIEEWQEAKKAVETTEVLTQPSKEVVNNSVSLNESDQIDCIACKQQCPPRIA
ncbi:hypothetical protein [Pseudobacteriovorax antillogorgiicola]|uniref:hypothetical protein n=1 Tax=Pseudobacteriovorax antillogorgiicola TaxID=1513793 RepID=UPI001046803D|nr:hypothetical protein [Pseudobacteriovorax antillogorgiicola]